MELKTKEWIIHLQNKKINGITGNQLDNLLDIITLNKAETILIDGKELIAEKYQYRRTIEIVESNIIIDKPYKSIYEWMWYELKNKEIYPKNITKKIKDAVRIVGLQEDILNKGIFDCSISEQKKLQIASCFLSNPDMIILKEPYKILDLNNQKFINNLLHKFAEKYNKIVIIVSNNADILYQYTDYLIIHKNSKIVIEGETNKVYQMVDLLKKHRIEIPKIIEITYLARKKKNIKIDYYKDIRDIIKDIYKHVKR